MFQTFYVAVNFKLTGLRKEFVLIRDKLGNLHQIAKMCNFTTALNN